MREGYVKLDLAVSIPTFVGSSLSFFAASTVLLLQLIYPPGRHFRHALIVNLLISDLMNSLGNTISGAYFLSQGSTPATNANPSAACVANAWVNQLSVQTIDFNILLISVIVLISVVRAHWISDLSTRAQIFFCVGAWIPGLITSNVALGLNSYGFVSGNWCWIRTDRLDLRYGLTHGWRLAIFFATIAIYTCIYVQIKRIYGKVRAVGGTFDLSVESQTRDPELGLPHTSDTHQVLPSGESTLPQGNGSQQQANSGGFHPSFSRQTSTSGTRSVAPLNSQPSFTPTLKSQEFMPPPPKIQKMLLMNGYPIAYIILWIPGIANRLVESTHGSSPQWLSILQASTQFIGLINALTYGISEQMKRRAWESWKHRHDFVRADR
ncbi:unnamed protein product [Clonostachys rosea]|uniref:Glucose receptor Git3 N-terminal domain-containing protein n=1 Tax=Bionectria ochroleuca TaxID=29856 RepID=A0ABY6UCL9_BIOOC|nr:unnamed protein product [Clonostachys rosea]